MENYVKILSKESFEFLFKPLISELGKCNWLALSDSFEFPLAWLDIGYDEETDDYLSGPIYDFEKECPRIEERSRDCTSVYGYHLKPGMLERYAAGVSDDWSTLMATTGSVEDALAWLKGFYSSRDRVTFVESRVVVYIESVDGAYWQAYVRNSELRTKLLHHLSSVKKAVITEIPWPDGFIL